MKHLDEEALMLYHYGELPGRADATAHVKECARCGTEYEHLALVLAAVDTFDAPQRSDAYGGEVWARVQRAQRAEANQPRVPTLVTQNVVSRWSRTLDWLTLLVFARSARWPRLAFAGGIAALILAAFVAGRFWPGQVAAPVAPTVASTAVQTDAPARDRVLMIAIGDHLERSQMVLVELINREPSATVDISSEQAWAGDLVAASRLYRQTAVQDGEAALADVLDDLERVLVEVANSPSMLSSMEFEDIRQRIEAQGILFKVRIVGSKVQQRENAPVQTSSKIS